MSSVALLVVSFISCQKRFVVVLVVFRMLIAVLCPAAVAPDKQCMSRCPRCIRLLVGFLLCGLFHGAPIKHTLGLYRTRRGLGETDGVQRVNPKAFDEIIDGMPVALLCLSPSPFDGPPHTLSMVHTAFEAYLRSLQSA